MKQASAIAVIFMICMVFPALSGAQDCAPRDIRLLNQSDIDSFQDTHGPCDTVTGGLWIEGFQAPNDIVNLSGLSGLKSVNSLSVDSTEALEHLGGLNNITELTNLSLRHNSGLVNLDALAKVRSELSGLILFNNPSLSDIGGLSGIADITLTLEITSNPLLESISDLPPVTTISGRLEIVGNDGLHSLVGLDMLRSVDGDVRIGGNDALASLDGLNRLEHIGRELVLYGNDSLSELDGLNALVEVEEGVHIGSHESLLSISGFANLQSVASGQNIYDLLIDHNAQLQSISGFGTLREIGGSLMILHNEMLSELTGFGQLTEVAGMVNLSGNDQMVVFDGLNNLVAVGDVVLVQLNEGLREFNGINRLQFANDIVFAWNRALETIGGFQSLTSTEGAVVFRDNRALQHVTGFPFLVTIGKHLSFEGSGQLSDLEGFSALRELGDGLSISWAGQLTNLDPLSGLVYVGGSVVINNNLMLADCRGISRLVDSIDDAGPGPGPSEPGYCPEGRLGGLPDIGECLSLQNNLPGCNSTDEVLFRIDDGDEAALVHAIQEANVRGPDHHSEFTILHTGEAFVFDDRNTAPSSDTAVPVIHGDVAIGRENTDHPPILFTTDPNAAGQFRLFEVADRGRLALNHCEISGFGVPADAQSPSGGAILQTGEGALSIENCYFYDNEAALSGGAIAIHGQVRGNIRRSRFTDNRAPSGCSTYASISLELLFSEAMFTGECEGHQVHLKEGLLSVEGSSFAGNGISTAGEVTLLRTAFDTEPVNPSQPNSSQLNGLPNSACQVQNSGSVRSQGWNIADDHSCALDTQDDLSATDPMLVHDDSGLLTPLADSPAIDSGPVNVVLGDGEEMARLPCGYKDLGGYARPQDFDGDGDFECDRGAVEAPGTGEIAAGHSGVFYNPDRNGEGTYVEILSETGTTRSGFVFFKTATQPDNALPIRPGALEASSVSVNSATINWGASYDDDGDRISYQVDYRRNENWQWLNGGNTTATNLNLTGLEAATSYDIRVVPNDGKEDGIVRVAQSLFRTRVDSDNNLPTRPGAILASAITSSSASVEWEPSIDVDDESLAYRVEYRRSADRQWILAETTTAASQGLIDLESATSYDVRITPFDGQDYGAESIGLGLFTTAARIGNTPPSRPGELAVTGVTANSAIISWPPSIDDDADPITYMVEFQRMDEGRWKEAGLTTATNFELAGLDSDTAYNLRITPDDGHAASAVVYTFTFRPDGSGPAWFLGVGDVIGNGIVIDELFNPIGATFGDGFDPDDIEMASAGGMSMVFPDCQAEETPGGVSYSGDADLGFEGVLTSARRLSHVVGCGETSPSQNAGLSGSFFDWSRNGEGIIVRWLPDERVLVIFFTYDPEGDQMWIFGTGPAEGKSVKIDAVYPTEFATWGRNFDPDDVTLSHWGTFTLEYTHCDSIVFNYDSSVPGYGSALRYYNRLTRLMGLQCPEF